MIISNISNISSYISKGSERMNLFQVTTVNITCAHIGRSNSSQNDM